MKIFGPFLKIDGFSYIKQTFSNEILAFFLWLKICFWFNISLWKNYFSFKIYFLQSAFIYAERAIFDSCFSEGHIHIFIDHCHILLFHSDFTFFLLLPFATKQVFMQSCLAKSSRSFYLFEQTVYDFKAQPKNISKYLYSWSGCLGIPNYSNDEMMKMTIPWGLLCVRYFVCVWWKLHKTLFLSSWNRNFLAL